MRIAGFDELRVRLAQNHMLTAASIDVTRRCNLHCIHCLRVLDDTAGLALADVRLVIDQLVDLGCLLLTITGGEPFARQDVIEIVRYAWLKRLPVKIVTNGTLITAEQAAELKHLHVAEVQFSVYAAAPHIHDAITRHSGSHERTMQGIALAKACGLNTTVAAPLLAPNAQHIPALRQLCLTLGVTMTEGPLIFPRENGDPQPLRLVATSAQLAALERTQQRDALQDQTPNGPCSDVERLCSAGIDRLAIGCNGTVYPCDALHIPLGCVQTDRLADIWSHSEALARLRSLRRTYPAECSGCSARSQCMWCPGLSLSVNGDPAGPNAQDCRRTRLAHSTLGSEQPGWSVPESLRTL
jgi:mycofactocin biosynthetic radical S-adenosylmethionine protein MftC